MGGIIAKLTSDRKNLKESLWRITPADCNGYSCKTHNYVDRSDNHATNFTLTAPDHPTLIIQQKSSSKHKDEWLVYLTDKRHLCDYVDAVKQITEILVYRLRLETVRIKLKKGWSNYVENIYANVTFDTYKGYAKIMFEHKRIFDMFVDYMSESPMRNWCWVDLWMSKDRKICMELDNEYNEPSCSIYGKTINDLVTFIRLIEFLANPSSDKQLFEVMVLIKQYFSGEEQMGGNALKTVVTERLDKFEYDVVSDEVMFELMLFGNNRGIKPNNISVVPAYRAKASYGDLDIVIGATPPEKNSTIYSELSDWIYTRMQASELVVNGNVWSFDYKNFQVDLIFVESDLFQTALVYYSYNDLGGLMGRIARRMGMKYGSDGLKARYWYNENQVSDWYVVSTEPYEIFELLGYDYEVFTKGFDTLTDIFEYTASSPFFNKELFVLENRNNHSRSRDSKRKTYTGFLTWLSDKSDLPAFNWPSLVEKGSKQNASDVLSWMFNNHTGLVTESHCDVRLRVIHNEWVIHSDMVVEEGLKSYFNGNLVKEWTGLTGLDFNMFMKHCKEQKEATFSKDQWVVMCVNGGVKKWVLDLYHEYVVNRELV